MAKHVGNNLCIEDKSRLASKLWKAVAERDEARAEAERAWGLLRDVVDAENFEHELREVIAKARAALKARE